MVLGVRILSTNLSGKTGNVTFLPLSGGTIDLGEQTIPFNYLTDFPYGTYEIYIPLYDYTYELVVLEPIPNNGQSIIIFDTQVDSTLYSFGVLNYSDITAQIIVTDIDENDWSFDNYWVTNESGYVYSFYLESYSFIKLFLFTNEFGVEIGRYSADTDNYNSYNLDFFGFVFDDIANGVLTYFDGFSVGNFTYNNSNEYCIILDDYDYVMSNRNFLLKVQNISASTYSVYLTNPTSRILIDQYDYNLFQKTYSYILTGTFILSYSFDYTSGYYTEIKILSQEDGSVLQTQSLTPDTYINGPYYQFFGNNKIIVLFYNYSDSNVPYTIFYYNGDTDTKDVLIKPRGIEYFNNQIFGQIGYDNGSVNTGIGIIVFWDNYGGPYTSLSGQTVSYLDFVYVTNGSDVFEEYTYQDSGIPDKSLNIYYSYFSDTYYGHGCPGDGTFSIISIGNNGVNYSPLDTFPFDKPLDKRIFGNKYINILWSDFSYTAATFSLFQEGILVDTLSFNKTSSWNSTYTYGVYAVTNFEQSWYVNNALTAFTPTEVYYNNYQPYFYWTESHHQDGRIILFDYNLGSVRVITANNFYSGLTLPINGGNFDIGMGKSNFMYVYNEPGWGGKVKINLYDYELNLLNSITTDSTNWNNTDAYKDRYSVNFYNGVDNSYTNYLVNEIDVTPIITSGNYNDRLINDYYWD